ncbi:MAG: pyruvate kinase, partial [Leptospirales bacterium]|nr:pyruvate kinase [Leptospirales bacterium]
MFVKIVCTVGPASENYEVLASMVKAGMNVARLNFSHGDYEGHERKLRLIRKVESDLGVPIPVLLDTQGPEIRTGMVENNEIILETGNTFVLTETPCFGTPQRVYINCPNIAGLLSKGQDIYIDDGTLHLQVEGIDWPDIMCKVIVGGPLGNTKGINIPKFEMPLPALSEKDKEDIAWGVRHGMEYLAVSFVKKRSDILDVRKLLKSLGGNLKIIAKIETYEAVQNFDEIVDAADGVMVARGDLGVEIPAEDVPLVQKRIIDMCRSRGKPVIVATQMLDSMIRNPRPTRAEVNDVANAVLDGTDAVMLSGESASGIYPVQSVATMRRIVDRTEKELSVWSHQTWEILEQANVPDAVSDAAVLISKQVGAAAIICLTRSGMTARMIGKYRPACPILGVTPLLSTWRELALCWGIHPVMLHELSDFNMATKEAIETCVKSGQVKEGELVVITAGLPLAHSGSTNIVKVLTTGEIILTGMPIVQKNTYGKVCVALNIKEAEKKITDGCILAVHHLSDEYNSVLGRVGAVISESGADYDGAVLALEYDIPLVINVKDALLVLSDDMEVTVDGMRGLIYRGQVKLV